jgi:phage baseplate assembly protein W
MFDVKLLTIRDLLPVSKVTYAKVSPPTLDIYGQKFSEASIVQINDLDSPEFMILSDNRILAQIPDGQSNSQVHKVTVLADTPSTKRSSQLHFEMGKSFYSLAGIEKLVQIFCKILLQSPGSDSFNPTIGGGLLALVGMNVERDAERTLVAAALSAVSRAKDQVVSMQSKNKRIPKDERLLAASVEAAGYDPNTTTLAVRVYLTAASGKQAVANLTF